MGSMLLNNEVLEEIMEAKDKDSLDELGGVQAICRCVFSIMCTAHGEEARLNVDLCTTGAWARAQSMASQGTTRSCARKSTGRMWSNVRRRRRSGNFLRQRWRTRLCSSCSSRPAFRYRSASSSAWRTSMQRRKGCHHHHNHHPSSTPSLLPPLEGGGGRRRSRGGGSGTYLSPERPCR